MRKCVAQSSRTAPVMADQRDVFQLQVLHQASQIRRVSIETVCVLVHRLFREPETDHVRNDHAIAGFQQRRDHVPVKETPGRIAMQQHHRFAGAFVNEVHAPAIHPRVLRRVRPLVAKVGGEVGYQHVGIIINLYQPGNSRTSSLTCSLNDMPALAEINFTSCFLMPLLQTFDQCVLSAFLSIYFVAKESIY